ncbi:MAG TPA: hypothetical protein VKQ32_29950 [Polyangia bacterium]|nr:hypothetical protein [Polyangia bacterium]
MLPSLVAISGMLAAAPAAAGSSVATIEISFATHAGEGAAGAKRFARNGCYQGESGGGTGGGGHAHDSHAGCLRPADVAAVFARLDALPGDALVREAATGGAPDRSLGAPRTRVVLVRTDGSRWLAANRTTGDEVLRAVNDIPSESQWYAPPPDKPVGGGPQLLVLATEFGNIDSSWRLEGSLASDGRWWCHRTTVNAPGAEPRLPSQSASPIKDAPARLGRILEGTNPGAPDDGASAKPTRDKTVETSVEVVWPGKTRARLRPWRMAGAVVSRFAEEMQALARACGAR